MSSAQQCENLPPTGETQPHDRSPLPPHTVTYLISQTQACPTPHLYTYARLQHQKSPCLRRNLELEAGWRRLEACSFSNVKCEPVSRSRSTGARAPAAN